MYLGEGLEFQLGEQLKPWKSTEVCYKYTTLSPKKFSFFYYVPKGTLSLLFAPQQKAQKSTCLGGLLEWAALDLFLGATVGAPGFSMPGALFQTKLPTTLMG